MANALRYVLFAGVLYFILQLVKAAAPGGIDSRQYKYTLMFSKNGWQYSQPKIDEIKSLIHKGVNIANNPFKLYFEHDGNISVYQDMVDDNPNYNEMLLHMDEYQKTVKSQTHFFIWILNGTPQYKAATFKVYDSMSGAYYLNAWQTFSEPSPYPCDKAFGVNGIGINAHEMGHVLGASESDKDNPNIMNWINSCYYGEFSANEVLTHLASIPHN